MAASDLSYRILLAAVNKLSGPAKDAKGDLEGLEKGLRKNAGEADKFNRKWAQTIELSRGVGAAVTAVSAAVMVGSHKAIQAATDLNEAINKSSVVFGEQATMMEEWSQGSARALGLSQRAALEAAGSFGVLFESMEPQAAAEMSQSLVALSADIASMNNLDPAQALIALRAGLVGETEPLRRVGILLNAAAVEAKAMEMGLKDANGEISESAKVQARYALIMERSKVQQGDFARTSGEVANQQRIARAEMENAAAAAGGALREGYQSALAAMLPLLEATTEFLRTDLGQRTVQVAAGFAAVGTAVGPMLMTLPTIIGHWSAITTAASAAWAAMTGPVGLAIAGIAAVGAAIYGIATAHERAEEAARGQLDELKSGAVTSEQALSDMRAEVQGMSLDLEDMGDNARDAADDLARMREEYGGGLVSEEAKIQQRVLQLQRERNKAVQAYGENSRQALEAENRLLTEQERLLLVRMRITEQQIQEQAARDPGWFMGEDQKALRAQLDEMKKTFDAIERSRSRVQNGLDAMNAAEGELSAVTRELTQDEKDLADAHEDAGDAAQDMGKAHRDAARDVEDAEERVRDAQESIAEATEDAQERVEDATRAVQDAQEDYARSVEDAAERVQDAQDRAARSVENAQERIQSIQERIRELDAPELTPAQRKEQRRRELYEELAEAQGKLAETQKQAQVDIQKAEEDAARSVEQAARRVQDAQEARAKAIEDGQKRIEDAYKRHADAVEALARVEERAQERMAAAIDKVTEANEKLAKAQEKVNQTRPSGVRTTEGGGSQPTQPAYAPQSSAGGSQTVYVPQPSASAGGGAGGVAGTLEALIRVALDSSLVVQQASANAGQIIGSPGGRQAVIRIMSDQMQRRR